MDERNRERRLLLKRAEGGKLTPEEEGFLDARATIRSFPPIGRTDRWRWSSGFADEDEPPR